MKQNPSTYPDDIEAALEELQRRIADGHEFPDAAWSVARAYNVDQSMLEAAYDDAHA